MAILECASLPDHDPEVFWAIMEKFNPKRYFEFGLGQGATSEIVRKVCPNAEIFSLDIAPWAIRPPKYGVPNLGNHHIITANSHSWQIPKELLDSFDVVLIDGEHSAPSVANDTVKALSLVKQDGIILWHDVTDIPGHGCQIYLYFQTYVPEMAVKWIQDSNIGFGFAKELRR
jgi:predicted O-methyltransferase YrrM